MTRSTKVRLVRCPKCSQLLAELPGIFLYRCGGCNTILQAKNQHNQNQLASQTTDSITEAKPYSVTEEQIGSSNNIVKCRSDEESSLERRHEVEEIELAHVSGVERGVIQTCDPAEKISVFEESTVSNHDLTIPSMDESLLGKDSGVNREEQVENATELHEDRNISNGLSSLYDVECSDNIDPIKVTDSLDQDSERHRDELAENTIDLHRGGSISNGLSSSNEVDRSDNKEIFEEPINLVKGTNTVDQDFEGHDSDSDESIGGMDLFPEVSSSIQLVNHENKELRQKTSERAEENSIARVNQCQKVDEYEREKCFEVFQEVDEFQSEARVFSEQENQEIRYVHGSGRKEVLLQDDFVQQHTDETSRNHFPDQNTTFASQMSVNITSANENLQKYFHRRGDQDFESRSSLEFIGSSVFSGAGHQPIVKLAGQTLSLMSKDGYDYAYDGGKSSNDGTDNPNPARRKGKDLYGVENTVTTDLEMRLWVPSPLSSFQENQRHPRGISPWKEAVLSNSKTCTRGYSGVLFSSTDLEHRNRKHLINGHSQPLPRTNLHSLESPSYYELDRMDLLRTVCELKDQLNRMHLPELSRDGRFHSEAMEETSAPYFDERDMYGDLNRSAYHLRYSQEKMREVQANVSRLGLSERDVYHNGHELNRSVNYQYSTQLPPPSSRYRSDHSVSHIDHNRLRMNSSKPMDYTSHFSEQDRESEFDRSRQRDEEMRRIYLRDKYYISKKVLMPVAGGSPFLSCYHCSELLQIPSDFLLFKRRYHQIRCSVCFKVLKFFLTDGMHIIPCLPKATVSNKTGNILNGNFDENRVPMPRSVYHQPGNSSYCSDDHGPSFRSYSTEVEALAMPASGLNQRTVYSNSREKSSGSYFEDNGDKKMKSILNESTSNNKRDADINSTSVGSSSVLPPFINATSEIEELEPSTKSRLHQLMGYRTPSQVFKR